MTVSDNPPARAPAWRRWAPFIVLLALLGFAIAMGWHKYLSFETLREQRGALTGFVGAQPWLAALLFIAIYAAFTMTMLPGAIWLTMGGGFLFGLAGGAALTIIGATLGATCLFLAAKSALGEGLRKRAGPFLEKLRAGFQKSPFSYMLFLRFNPIVVFPIANIAPAVLGAKLSSFVITTMIGIVPGVLAYTWIGSGLGAAFDAGAEPNLSNFARQLLPAFIALALVSLAPALIKQFGPKKPK
jgi:uncharacterized membrane protein YdjX (TVP38/TMEM64 family)